AWAAVPHPARGEEPLRPDRRDRRVRNGGPRLGGNAESFGAFPRRFGRAALRRRCVRGRRRLAGGWWGDLGAGGAGRRGERARGRGVVGWDSARLAMILAVLETRCGLSFSGRDVYLSVAGGLRITEPAADLAVAAALVSALADKPLPKQCVVFGEVALSGE